MIPAIKILKIQGRDWASWFLALELMKNGSYRGIQVTHNFDTRKPSKAAQKFVPSSHVGREWKEISVSEIPEAVQKRFAEYA